MYKVPDLSHFDKFTDVRIFKKCEKYHLLLDPYSLLSGIMTNSLTGTWAVLCINKKTQNSVW